MTNLEITEGSTWDEEICSELRECQGAEQQLEQPYEGLISAESPDMRFVARMLPVDEQRCSNATDESPIMTETAVLIIGNEVFCSDGLCGELSRVIIDPVAWSLTHLVVEPKLARGGGRLVPPSLVAESTEAHILLRCTMSNFEALEKVYDGAPFLGLELRRCQRAYARDGAIGHINGLVFDLRDNQVTQLLLDGGQLWGQKQVGYLSVR